MSKVNKKSPTRKRPPSRAGSRHMPVELTASERHILQILATGIDGEEPNVLAGNR